MPLGSLRTSFALIWHDADLLSLERAGVNQTLDMAKSF